MAFTSRDGSADSMACGVLEELSAQTICLEYSSILDTRVYKPNYAVCEKKCVTPYTSLLILPIILLLLSRSPNSPLEMSLTPAQHAKVILQILGKAMSSRMSSLCR